MNRDDFIDKILGGIFAVVAIIAAIVELAFGEVSAASIAACTKDIFSTLAVVVLFFAVIKDKMPGFKFEKRMNQAIDTWIKENSNMIVRKAEHDIEHTGEEPSCFSLDLKTSVVDFYEPNSVTKKTGLFLRIPMINKENYQTGPVELRFYMNKGTFFSNTDNNTAEEGYKQLSGLFCDLVNNKHHDFVKAQSGDKMIVIKTNNPILSSTDISEFVEVINTVYTAYLVAANMDYKQIKGTI